MLRAPVVIERTLTALDRRVGRYFPQNLTVYLVGLMAVAWLLDQIYPGFTGFLTFEPARVAHGEVWRLFTFVVLPPTTRPVFLFFSLWWTLSIGKTVSDAMGGFRYTLFWLVGMLGTSLLSVFAGVPGTNQFLLMSLLLAFATLFPDYEVMLFFVLRVRVKWLGLIELGLLALIALGMSGWQRLLPFVAVGNYLLFFGGNLYGQLRSRGSRPDATTRKVADEAPRLRRCTRCGVTEEDRSVEFRVCTCEKCGGKPTEFCLAHARDH